MISKAVRIRKKRQGLLHLGSMADHGFMLMTRLADTRAVSSSLRAIADEMGVSFYFLQKVALELRKAGLIKADRGKTGGYRLARPPSKITIKEILEALEGPLALMDCLDSGSPVCSHSASCRLRPGFDLINRIIVGALSKKTLKDLITAYVHSGIK
jgi:Rrf2 family protein